MPASAVLFLGLVALSSVCATAGDKYVPLARGIAFADNSSAENARPCFLSGYELGKSFAYHYSSAVTVEKSVEHAGAAAQQHRAEHLIEVEATIQCVNVDSDVGGAYHFELRVHGASWRRPQSADVHDTAAQQAERDAGLLASLQRPFYYSQRCASMELLFVFHPSDESDVVLNIKKNLIHAFDNKLQDAADGAAYDVEHADHLGAKTLSYAHEDTHDGDSVVTMTHDGDRTLRISDTTRAQNTVALASRNSKRTTLRNGVVQSVTKSDDVSFPTKAQDTPDSAQRSAEHAGTFRWHSTGVGEVTLLASDDRKRHAPNAFPAVTRDFGVAVRKRHAADDMQQRPPHRRAPASDDAAPLPDVGSDALVAALLADREQHYRDVVRWLRREPASAIGRLERACAALDDGEARMTLLRALGAADNDATQAALVAAFQLRSLATGAGAGAIAWTDDDRDAALVLITMLSLPTAATLDALEAFAVDGATPLALARQATLAFGTAAAAHQAHAERAQDRGAARRAQEARLTLLERLAASMGDGGDDTTHEQLLSLSLENAMRGVAPAALEQDMLDARATAVMQQRKRFGVGSIRDFVADAKCDGASCQGKSYDAQRPAAPRRVWNDTFGVAPFLAYLETALDSQADRSPSGRGYYGAFAGGKIDISAFGNQYSVASAYGKAQFAYANNVSACANYTLELYFHYLNNAYYFRAGNENNCTAVASTCEPNRPPDYARYNFLNSRDPSMLLRFFEFDETVDLAFVDVKFRVIGEGSLGFHYDWRFMVAPDRGGVALNGFVEPHAWAGLTATVGLWFMPDLLGIEAIAKLELLNASLPVIGGVNANTLKGCASIAFRTSALGGSLAIRVKLIVADVTHTVYRWNGIGFEAKIVDTKCCVECEAPCFNAFCNYRVGVCECDMWHDGVGCDIDCPPDCTYGDAATARGIECRLPQFPERGERHQCACARGNFGWNCKSECPPGNLLPSGVNQICSGHGECNGDGQCMCDEDFFGADCSITCPLTNADRGERCGANGRCVYNGVAARCECFANFVGAKCEAACPESQDERKAPCSRRGDCTLVDGKPSCMCHLGFYGDVCESIDTDGSGTALRLYAPPMPLVFEDTKELDAAPLTGVSHTGLWMLVDRLPAADGAATVVSWRHGRLRLGADGALSFCGGRDSSCVAVPGALALGQWTYVSVVVRFAGIGYEVFVRRAALGAAGAKRQWSGAPVTAAATEPFVPVGESGVRLGHRFAGRLDLLAISHKPANAGLAAEFDDAELAQLRDEIVPPTQPGLEFYCMFDLRRGAHLYDNVRLLRAKISDVGGRFVDSEIKLQQAALVSEIHVAFVLKGSDAPRSRDYAVDFAGKRYLSGLLSADFSEPSATLCKLSAAVNGVEVLGALAPVTGKGALLQALPPAALRLLRTGANTVEWRVTPATCAVTIEQSHLSVSTPAVDAVADFSGSPYSFIELDRTYSFEGSWTMDVWMFRDEVIYTQNGLVMSLVQPADVGPRARDSGSIRVYETGSTSRGVAIEYAGGAASALRFAQFSTPTGLWFHYTVGVEFAAGQCRIAVLLDGRPQVGRDGAALLAVACGAAGRVVNGGPGENKLRVGAGFAGKLNDFRLRRGTWTAALDVVGDMHKFKLFDEAALLAAYSFDDANDPLIFDSRAVADDASNRGTIRQGTFRTLIYGITHRWKNCPGTSYFSPEAVCSTRSLAEHGYCTHPRQSDDYECTCNPGYYGSDCAGECPGMTLGVACSGHGECFSFNETFCQCDAGFVGNACQFECPGWSEPLNRPQRECWGHGACQIADGGNGAVCACDAQSERYGPFCQFQYGEDPVASVIDKCRNCDGEQMICRDGVCVCSDGHYMFFGKCKKNAAAGRGAVSKQIVFLAVLAVAWSGM